MKYTENSLNILTAKSYKGIGKAWIVKNLKGNESVETIVSLLNKKIKGEQTNENEFENLKRNFEKKLLEKFDNELCDGIVALGDKDFPQHRGNVKESEQPIYLFYKGDLSLLDSDNINITVIGLLNPDELIESREQKIVSEIVKRNATIVSGLAFGCDSIAHKQALIGGKTIAILPSPLNNILPAKNKTLAFEIIEDGGLLVSEYYDEFKSQMELSSRYKERDRLQALFCDAIILVASYSQDSATRWNLIGQKLDSGARLAMGYAKDYSIPRTVMYDQTSDSENPMFDLNRELIKDRDVITLTQKNLQELIDKIEYRKNNNIQKFMQTNLFSW